MHRAQSGPRQVADLSGHQVGIEVQAVLDEAAAGALGQPDQGVGERQPVLVVDVGGDQWRDRPHHRGRHPAQPG